MLLVGRGVIPAPLHAVGGIGLRARKGDDRRYIVESDELLSAFMELDAMLL